jgi:arylsulfatase A
MLVSATLTVDHAACAQSKPNVIVMMADDMGIGDTSAYLGKKLESGAAPIAFTVKTPQLERLASMGTVFTDAHSPSSMCSTTRYALLTGRHAYRSYVQTTVHGNWTRPPMIDTDRQTIGDMFQRAGYATTAIGKWHLGNVFLDQAGNPVTPSSGAATETFFNGIRWPTAGNPNVTSLHLGAVQQGFDYYYGVLTNNQPDNLTFRAFVENNTVQGIPTWNGGAVQANGWVPSQVGESLINKALDRIDAHAGVGSPASDKPLFMYYAPLSNHGDYTPPVTMNIQGQSFPIHNQAKLTNGVDGQLREDLVYENDVALGALLDKLESTTDPLTGQPMIDNTIIIFTSDNGADRTSTSSTAGLREDKRSIYEGGHRVPFIAAWAGHTPQGGTSDQVFTHGDLYATFAALTGTQLTNLEAEDSENILPAFLGQTTAQFQRPRNPIVHDDNEGNDITNGAVLAIRSGNMKLIVSNALVNTPVQPVGVAGRSIPVGLYDLSVDPQEQSNLLGNPAYAGLVEDLRQQVLRTRNQGFSRSTIQHGAGPLFATDGGTDLTNSLNGSVGFEFTVGTSPVVMTRLGLWDDGAGEIINQENSNLNQDGNTVGTPDGLATSHTVRLFDKSSGVAIATMSVSNAGSTVEGEFRYVNLPGAVVLYAGREYALTMSTAANDGDLYHSSVPFSGDAAIPSFLLTDFQARRSTSAASYPTLLPDGTTATGAPAEELYEHRFFVGPTGTLAAIPVSMADFDLDGDADGNDLLIWQRNIGRVNPTRAHGDADLDGVVGPLDLQLWKAAFASSSAALAAAGFVPEPASMTIALPLLAAAWAARRRRRCEASSDFHAPA